MLNSRKLTICICLSLLVEACFTTPILVKPEVDELPETGNTKASLGQHIGSAVAPVVGAVVGPLLVNIAHGITNGITNTLASGFEPLAFGHDPHPVGPFDLYLVNFDDDSRPYLLLESIGNDQGKPQYYGAAAPYNAEKSTNVEISHDTQINLSELVYEK